MADRDRNDWERGRDFGDRDRDFGRGGERDRGYQDRGVVSRGTDEVRSWFGDDDARRRREMDDQRDRQWHGSSDRDYGPNSERARSEHGWGREGAWDQGRQSQYGDQRDFVGRQNDGHYTEGSRWTGGGRDYGDQHSGRFDAQRSGGHGGYSSGQSSGSFSGGYGAGNSESGNWRGGYQGSQGFQGSQGRGFEGGFQGSGNIGSNVGAWGSGGFGSGGYGVGSRQEFGQGTEGRWGGSQSGGGFQGGWQDSGPSYGSSSGAGSSFAGRGPRNYQRSDDRIREDVNERLTADPRIDASDVDVRVERGEVILTGTVHDGRTRRLAEEVVEDMPGVRDVRNELRVNRNRGGFNEGDSRHREIGEQSRGREDGAIGHTGDPQTRNDVTTVNTKEARK